jgi:hypothetical protein
VEPFKHKTIPYNERPYWDRLRSEQFTNGQFSISFAPLSGLPVLRIAAPHHLSLDTEPLRPGTNMIIRLKSASGPRGIVQLPAGQPAQGATVLFMADSEQCGLNGSGELSVYGQKENFRTTAADGRFAFEPRSNGRTVYISHPQGWAELEVSEFSDAQTIRLKPWASIVGKLVNTNGLPVSDIPVSITPYGGYRVEDPYINFQPSTTTDKLGRFQLDTVPPDKSLQLVRRIMSPGGNGWSHAPQTWFVAEAGKTNDLGKVTFDQPPPKPILDRLKEKLGL